MTRHAVGAESEIPNGSLRGVEVGGRELCIARTDDGEIYALDNLCTHEFAPLCDGDLFGREIQCPLHNSKFDLATGEVRGLPATEPTTTYPVTVEDGTVYVDVGE